MDFEKAWALYLEEIQSALMYFDKEKLEGGVFKGNLAGGKLSCKTWKEYIQMCIVLLSMIVLFVLATVVFGSIEVETIVSRRIANDIVKLFDIQSQQQWLPVITRLCEFVFKLAQEDFMELQSFFLTKRQPNESLIGFLYRKLRVVPTILILSQLQTFNKLIGALCTLKTQLNNPKLYSKELTDLQKYFSKPLDRPVSSEVLLETIQTNFSFVSVYLKEKQD